MDRIDYNGADIRYRHGVESTDGFYCAMGRRIHDGIEYSSDVDVGKEIYPAMVDVDSGGSGEFRAIYL